MKKKEIAEAHLGQIVKNYRVKLIIIFIFLLTCGMMWQSETFDVADDIKMHAELDVLVSAP